MFKWLGLLNYAFSVTYVHAYMAANAIV